MAEDDKRDKSVDELRREIEATRANMTKTIGALETKLNPDRLKEQATDSLREMKDNATEKLREKTVGRVENLANDASYTLKGAGNDVFEAAKKNPLPAALAAIGLGWLFMESRNQSRRGSFRDDRRHDRDYYRGEYRGDYRTDYRQTMRESSPYGYRYGYEYGELPEERRWEAEQGRRPVERVREAAGNIGEKASDVASGIGEKAGDIAEGARMRAENLAEGAQYRAYRVRGRFEEMLEQNPLLIGAAAVAVGAAIGMSLPHTEAEDQFMGSARDKVMEKAQDKATETFEKVEHVAKEAGEAAKETVKSEAQKQNLTK